MTDDTPRLSAPQTVARSQHPGLHLKRGREWLEELIWQEAAEKLKIESGQPRLT